MRFHRFTGRPYSLLCCLCLLVLITGSGPAQGGKGSLASKLLPGGLLEFENFTFLENRGAGLIDSRNQLRFLPDLEVSFNDRFASTLAVEFRGDASDTSRSRVSLDRAYLDISLENLDLRLGRQIVHWGRADGFRPTDSFKRHDFTDFLDEDEEPIWAAKLDYFIGEWAIEWVWVPVFEPDIFPLDPENRWATLPTSVEIPDSGVFDLGYVIDRSGEPPKSLRSSQTGVRIQRHQSGIDWSVSYYRGFDRIPTFVNFDSVATDPVDRKMTVALTPVHERVQVMGLDWSSVVKEFGLRGELTYTFTSDRSGADPLIDDPYLRFVAGVDRTFSGIVSSHDFSVNLEYLLDTEVPRQGASNQADVQLRLRHFFEHGLWAYLEYRLSPFRRIRISNFLNLGNRDFLVQGEFAWQPRDALTWSFGGDLMGGGEDTFFGMFSENQRLRTRLTFHF